MITSGEQVLALAGIMGGEDTEVRAGTTNVLLESAHFPPAAVRRTMRRLGMHTEGGQRWARGVDPAGAEPVCDQAARLMATLAGGPSPPGCGRPGVGEREAIRSTGAVLGAAGRPRRSRVRRRPLRRYGCRTEVADRRTCSPSPPWRFDLELGAPGEEVARGGLRPAAADPAGATGAASPTPSGCAAWPGSPGRYGRDEARTYPFLSQAALDRSAPGRRPPPRDAAAGHPLSEEAPELRTTLLPGLEEVAGRNLARGLDGVASTSWGRCSCQPKEELPAEPLTLGICSRAGAGGPLRRRSPAVRLCRRQGRGRGAGARPWSGVGFRRPSRCLPSGRCPPCSSRTGRSACAASSTRGGGNCSCPPPPSRSSWSWPAAGRGAAMRPAATPCLPGALLRRGLPVPRGWRPATWSVLAEAGGELWLASPCSTPTRGRRCRPVHRTWPTGSRSGGRPHLTDGDGAATRDRMAPLPPNDWRRSSAPPGRVERRVGSVRPRTERWARWSIHVAASRVACAPRGFRASAVDAGLAAGPGPDLGLSSASRLGGGRPLHLPPVRVRPGALVAGPAAVRHGQAVLVHAAAPTPPTAPRVTPTRPPWRPLRRRHRLCGRRGAAVRHRGDRGPAGRWPTPPRPPTRHRRPGPARVGRVARP